MVSYEADTARDILGVQMIFPTLQILFGVLLLDEINETVGFWQVRGPTATSGISRKNAGG